MAPRAVVSWLRWPAPLVLVAIALHLVYLWPGGPDGHSLSARALAIDEGTVLYDSLRITRGAVMYRDFFEFQGPVFYYLHALLFAATGASVLAARVLFVASSAISTGVIASLATRVGGRWAGAGAGAFHALVLVPMWPHAYPHWYAETFVLLGVALQLDAAPRSLRLGAAGLCFGLAALTIQSLGGPCLVAAVAAAALVPLSERRVSDAGRAALPIVAGALVPVGIAAAYFAATGALDQWIYDTLVWPSTHYGLMQTDARHYGAHFGALLDAHKAMPAPLFLLAILAWGVLLALPFATLPTAVRALRALRAGERSAQAPLSLSLVALAAIVPLWLGVTRPDVTHVAFVAGLSLPVAFATHVALARSARIVGIAMLAATVPVYGFKLVTTIDAPPTTDWREAATANSRDILELVPPGDTAVLALGGGFTHLYGPASAISFTYLPQPPGYYTEPQWRRMAKEIAQHRPAALLLTPQLVAHFATVGLDLRATHRVAWLGDGVLVLQRREAEAVGDCPSLRIGDAGFSGSFLSNGRLAVLTAPLVSPLGGPGPDEIGFKYRAADNLAPGRYDLAVAPFGLEVASPAVFVGVDGDPRSSGYGQLFAAVSGTLTIHERDFAVLGASRGRLDDVVLREVGEDGHARGDACLHLAQASWDTTDGVCGSGYRIPDGAGGTNEVLQDCLLGAGCCDAQLACQRAPRCMPCMLGVLQQGCEAVPALASLQACVDASGCQ